MYKSLHDDSQRLYMHRAVCDLDFVRDQADGEPQRVARAARGAGESMGTSPIVASGCGTNCPFVVNMWQA